MSRKSMWSFKFSTASLVLIPTAVGINYVGKFFASALKLPLWLDSIRRSHILSLLHHQHCHRSHRGGVGV